MEKKIYTKQFEFSNGHWWFDSRKEIIKKFLDKNIKGPMKILDFGCGVGTNIEMLQNFGDVYVFDESKDANKYIRKLKKIDNNKIIKNIKNSDIKFDLILALDVLEHIEDDDEVIQMFSKKLNKNGKILITVPAYQFLFCSKDEILMHKRRYNLKEISKKIDNSFEIKKKTYFNFFLSPLIFTAAMYYKIFNISYKAEYEKKPNNFVNMILKKIFCIEKFLINKFNFPFGVSIFIFAERKYIKKNKI